jgi:Zn-dependent protease with chaperone function
MTTKGITMSEIKMPDQNPFTAPTPVADNPFVGASPASSSPFTAAPASIPPVTKMDFSRHQNKAKNHTIRLGCLYVFGLGVLTIVPTITALLITQGADMGALAILCLVGVPILVLGGSLLKSAQLSSGGGRAVAEYLGGRQITANTTDPAERLLYNVAEETARAAGAPMPALYIEDNERCINAFAAGFSPDDAAISFTRGSVELFTRDEMQGVMAHEFAHIVNGDMRISTRLMGITYGLGLLLYFGDGLLYAARYAPPNTQDGNRGGGARATLGLVFVLVGFIGIVFSRIMQATISRQREFLADASAVQFTGNPAGIAGALKKIGCSKVGSGMDNRHAAEASHLFFGDVGIFSFFGILSTHPNLITRIKRLDPSFDGKFPEQVNPVRTLVSQDS